MASSTAANGHAGQQTPPVAVGTVSTPGYVEVDPFTKVAPSSAGTTPERRALISNDDDIEDYDSQKPDPDALVQPTSAGVAEGLVNGNGFDGTAENKAAHARRKSIPIRLEKTGRRGRYMLHADDAEVGEILRAGFEKKEQLSKRSSIRELVFTRRFTTFDRQNPSSHDSPFHGFFTLFWIAMGLLLIRMGALNWKMYGSVVGPNQIMNMMFSRDVLVLGLSDVALLGLTVLGVVWQRLCAAGYVRWDRAGYIIQNLWQLAYVGGFVGWTFYREWPWTHTIFLVLHGLVYLMKQHSYAFYNGYLSLVLRRKRILEKKLKQLEAMDPIDTPVSSPSSPTLPKSVWDTENLRHRRHGSRDAPTAKTPNLAYEPDDLAAIQQAITDKQPISHEQMDAYNAVIKSELEALEIELRGKCQVSRNFYPSNLTLWNWFEWMCLPTLVYELEYPRQPRTNWWYVAEKTAATFGTLIVMMGVSQAYIYPSVAEAMQMKEDGAALSERWAAFPWILSEILFPLLIEQLLTWYVIWECILNVLAEVWCFADRGFYGDWWNSRSFDAYARDWNRPVHAFLLRHVYGSSISTFKLSKNSATFVTFLLSALVHELCMFCLFHKVRGYLFFMQLLQMPLVMMSRMPFLRNRPTLGNVIVWIGLFVGPSFLTSMYLVI